MCHRRAVTLHHRKELWTSKHSERADDPDVALLLVDLPKAEILFTGDADEGLGSGQVPHHLHRLAVDCEPAVELVQLTDMQQENGALAHS